MEAVIKILKEYVPWIVPIATVLVSQKAQVGLGITISGILRTNVGRKVTEWIAWGVGYLGNLFLNIKKGMLKENVREEVAKEFKQKQKKEIKKKVEERLAENPTVE